MVLGAGVLLRRVGGRRRVGCCRGGRCVGGRRGSGRCRRGRSGGRRGVGGCCSGGGGRCCGVNREVMLEKAVLYMKVFIPISPIS